LLRKRDACAMRSLRGRGGRVSSTVRGA
jgi:hypothetical protein